MRVQAAVQVRDRLQTLEWLSRQAFDEHPHLSLLANLRRLRDEDWTTLPPTGGRSIASILEHVGRAKWLYQDRAFGPGSFDAASPTPAARAESGLWRPEQTLAWLREGHSRWMASLAGLADDAELERDRLSPWGERVPTVRLVQIVMAHDTYHAGEINHLRALLQGDDLWR